MNSSSGQSTLLEKYDVPTPRYTSYPTVPCWDCSSFSDEKWVRAVRSTFDRSNQKKGISLYIHLPYCESLCTYCACTTRITRNHKVEIPYIQAILKEWEHYKRIFGSVPQVRELHLGGGTPTFFSGENLDWLVTYLLEGVELHPEFEFSFEGHPNNTTANHLKKLHDVGFSRVSFGVQDLDEKVQRTINRIQPYENLERATREARAIGYKSVSFDLIYGLPFQSLESISRTFEKVLTLKPDRIAFYSYAHVPWIKPGQRGYEDNDLPSRGAKRNLYEIGRHMLNEAGYFDIGMDHFALPHDALFEAHQSGTLHRNFMGYTTTNTELLVGLGASAISDARLGYAQNRKKVEDYINSIGDTGSAICKGHILSEEDLVVRDSILKLSCQNMLQVSLLDRINNPSIHQKFLQMASEGILEFDPHGGIRITEDGKPFIRNVCSVLDKRMNSLATREQVFSKAI